ncbi:MAG: GNAT family N-acetyltransferase [Syntrophobacterales bacterium]|nr:GNAT family N-acetyltransferase [Syntrophobacterales bacterium]
MNISAAGPVDAAAILAIQKLAYESEARIYEDFAIPPLLQSLEELREEFARKVVLKAAVGERLVGSVRGDLDGETCRVERLSVHPDFQGRGIGSALMHRLEQVFPEALRMELFTGHKSARNLRLYQKLGYRSFRQEQITVNLTYVFLEKEVERAAWAQ